MGPGHRLPGLVVNMEKVVVVFSAWILAVLSPGMLPRFTAEGLAYYYIRASPKRGR